jgi:hypothetical protein
VSSPPLNVYFRFCDLLLQQITSTLIQIDGLALIRHRALTFIRDKYCLGATDSVVMQSPLTHNMQKAVW